ncbi:hypothetical protein [Christiangramia sediminis]|uniref:Alpha/beta hydrolase n=1 Tax=Christiangramia sediminis TaxID=2881336 RepID=A0A9X1LLE0_9FLAO|nr:hypothetical protein [Christiangramia sediminis]MCB7482473.1 hypothetical protein [Christiangramia sediminis]
MKNYSDTEFNIIIVSSMDALNAYIISENTGRPALLFNPPLVKYKPIEFERRYIQGLVSKQILLGGSDDVVDPSETMAFLSRNLKSSELDIKIDPRLGHRIPLSVFEEQVELSYKALPSVFDGWDNEKLEKVSESLTEIKDGGAALFAYQKLQFEDMPALEHKASREGLLRYCELDTLAMVMIYEYFREVSEL